MDELEIRNDPKQYEALTEQLGKFFGPNQFSIYSHARPRCKESSENVAETESVLLTTIGIQSYLRMRNDFVGSNENGENITNEIKR